MANDSRLANYARDFQSVPNTVSAVADALKTTIDTLRNGITELGDLDPVSEDLTIAISATLEKHLWMVQAQKV